MACPECTTSLLGTGTDPDTSSAVDSVHVNDAETVLASVVLISPEPGDDTTGDVRVWDVSNKASPGYGTPLTLHNVQTAAVGVDDTLFVPGFDSDRLRIISVDITTNPPSQLQDLQLPVTGLSHLVQVGGMAASGSRLYVIDSNSIVTPGRIIRVVDVTNPSGMSTLHSFDISSGWAVNLSNAVGLATNGNTLYVTGTNSLSETWLVIFDLTTATAPAQLGGIQLSIGPSLDLVEVLDDLLFVSGTVRNRFIIVDVSDPADPEEVSSTLVGNNRTRGLKPVAGLLYTDAVSPPAESGNLKIWDVSDPSSPVQCQVIANEAPATLGLWVTSDHLYQGTGFPEFYIYDVEDCNTGGGGGDPGDDSSYLACFALGDYLYALSELPDLQIFDISDPSTPTKVGAVALPHAPTAICLLNSIAYVTDEEGNLHFINVDDPTNPVIEQTLTAKGENWSFVNAVGTRIFLSGASSSGIGQFDLEGNRLATLDNDGGTSQSQVQGVRIYFADSSDSDCVLYSYRIGGFKCAYISTGALRAEEIKTERVEGRHGFFKGNVVAKNIIADSIEGAGGNPTGPAGGVLDGTYPNPGLAASVAGAGLSESPANVLKVNVDDDTIEISSDALRVKAGGIGANELESTTVTPGSYTNTNLTVDQDGRITAASNGTGYTNEEAQDAVGSILVDSATIDFTYDDGVPSITAIVKDESITFSKIQNASGESKLVGRGEGSGAGDFQEISIGSGLSMSGTTLSASGGGGGRYREIVYIVDGSDNVDILTADGDALFTLEDLE